VIEFFAKRLAWTLLVIFAVSTATFFLTHLIPADPARTVGGPHASPEVIEQIREKLRLNEPVYVQYGAYLADLARLDLGKSYRTDRDVLSEISERLPNTAYLALLAMLFQLVLGVPLGLYSALRAGRAPDLIAMGVALVGVSAPTFLIGLFLMFFLGYRLDLFPIGDFGEGFFGHLYHAVLPAMTLGIAGAAYYSRLTRGEYLDVASRDFMRTARAKGLSERRVVLKHGLRNALIPLVTFAGLDLGTLMGGAIVTESIFAWPGIGRLAVDAILQQDIPLIMGTVLVASTLIVLANLLVDLLYAWLDPRIRLA
jgi:peptide/nickel transport system permease protein